MSADEAQRRRPSSADELESMARILAFIPDLLFGSRVLADLSAAGHAVELVDTAEDVRERLRDADVLVVDLAGERVEGVELVEGLSTGQSAHQTALAPSLPPTLGFYSHVDVVTRERAEQAGFDRVVPRSRMAREASSLVERLLDAEV